MASEWLEVTAKEYCHSVRDGTHDSPKPVEHGRFLVTSRHIVGGRLDLKNAYLISGDDFDEINKRSKVDRWDVLISMIGTVGEPCLVKDEPDFAIKNIGLFKTKGEIEGKWLYYYLRSPRTQQLIREVSRGTTQQYIPLGALRNLPVLVPPAGEQRAIVNILGTLDDKIELNRRQNETLEAMARALFKAWFVDFEPVRAKMEGRWQRDQSLPGLPAHLYDLFPDRLVESELGEIPEGWTVRAIEDVIKRLSVGKKYDQKTVNKEGRTPVLDQGKSGILGYHNDEPGVVATVDNPVVVFANHTCLMRLISYPFSAIQNVLPFIGKDISTIWVFYASIGKQSFVEYKGHWPDFVQHKVVVPPVNLAEIFSAYVHGYLRAIWQNEAESRPLIHLRDTLLPKLISGELRIRDAEAFLKGRG